MQYPIRVKGPGKDAVAKDGYAAGFTLEEQGDRLLLTRPDGGQMTIAKDGFTHLDVSLGEVPVAIAHYAGQRDDSGYCCVTCNGFTICATHPCCRNTDADPWTCC